jgi:hypothetical protein
MVSDPSSLQGVWILYNRQGAMMDRVEMADLVRRQFGQICNCDECKTPSSSLVEAIVRFIETGKA